MLSASGEKELETVPTSEKWVHKWGNFPSEMLREARFNFFTVPNIEGFIAYSVELGCAVTFGDPICAPKDVIQLAKAFHEYCREKRLNSAYIIASKEFTDWAINHVCNVMIEIGEELIFDPQRDPLEGNHSKLRNKVKHASSLGLTVHEYVAKDPVIEKGIVDVGAEWQKSRKGPQIYLGSLDFFAYRNDRRWFYIKNGNQIIAMALLSRLEIRQGWFLKYLIALPKSPRGTSELLMTRILEILKNENCPLLTYGMVPAEHFGEVAGIGKFKVMVAKWGFKIAKWIFKLEQRKVYWQQFHPKTEGCYILFEQPRFGIHEARVIMKSLKVNL